MNSYLDAFAIFKKKDYLVGPKNENKEMIIPIIFELLSKQLIYFERTSHRPMIFFPKKEWFIFWPPANPEVFFLDITSEFSQISLGIIFANTFDSMLKSVGNEINKKQELTKFKDEYQIIEKKYQELFEKLPFFRFSQKNLLDKAKSNKDPL